MSHNNTSVFLFTVQGILASLTCGLCCLIYAYCCNSRNEGNRNKRTISKVNGDTYAERATTAFKKSKVEKEAASKSIHQDEVTHVAKGVDRENNIKSDRKQPKSAKASAECNREGTSPQKESIQENYCHRRESKMDSGLSNQKNGQMDKVNGMEARLSGSNCEGMSLNMKNVNEYKDRHFVGIIPRNNSLSYDGRITEKNGKCENLHNVLAARSGMPLNWSNESKEMFQSNSEYMIKMVAPQNRCQLRSGGEQNEPLTMSNECRNDFNPQSVNSYISSNDCGREDNNRILKTMQPGEKNLVRRNNHMGITINRVEAKNKDMCGFTQKDDSQVATERANRHAYSKNFLDRQMVHYPKEEIFRVKSETLIRNYPGHGGASTSAQKSMNINGSKGNAEGSKYCQERHAERRKYCPEEPSTRRRNCLETQNHFSHPTMNGCEDFEDKNKCRNPQYINNYTPSKWMNFPHDEESTNRVFVKCEKDMLHTLDNYVPNRRKFPGVERNSNPVPVIQKEHTHTGSSEYNTYKYKDFSMCDTLYRKRQPSHHMSHFNNGKEIKNIIENRREEEAGALSYGKDKATCDMHSVSNNVGESTVWIPNVGHYHGGMNHHLSNGMSTNFINGERTVSAASSYGLAYNESRHANGGEGEGTPPKGSFPRLGRFTNEKYFASKGRRTDREGETSQTNRKNQSGNNGRCNDICSNRIRNENNDEKDRITEGRYYTRGKSKDSSTNRRNVQSMVDAVEMTNRVPRNSYIHQNKTKRDVMNCAHYSPLNEGKMENRKKKNYYQFPHDYHMGTTECLPCKEGTHICKNSKCSSVGICEKQKNKEEKNIYLKRGFPEEHFCLPNCNSRSWYPHCTEKISGNNESFFHSNKFEKNTQVSDINENFSQHISYNAHPFIGAKGLGQGGGAKVVRRSELSEDIYPLTDDNADYDGAESSRRGGNRSGNTSGVRSRNIRSLLLSDRINLGERYPNDEQKAILNKRGEEIPPVPVRNDEVANGRKRRKKDTKKRGTNSKEERDNQSNTPLLTKENARKLRQTEPSEYRNSQEINQIIHAYLQNSNQEYNCCRSDKLERENNYVSDKYTEDVMHSHGDVSPSIKRKKKNSNDNIRYNSCRTKVLGNRKGKNGRDKDVSVTEGEIMNSKRSSEPGSIPKKNEQTDQEEKLVEEDTSTCIDRIKIRNIRMKREKSDSKVLIKEEKDLRNENQTVRRSARMKSEKYKKKKKNIDSDIFVDTQNEQEEMQSESSKKNSNIANNDNIKLMEKKKKKKMSKTKTMELKIFKNKRALKEKENLKRMNEKYEEIDEYRCASGLVNFIIENIQKKKDKENFDDLLKYILKLINIYKIKTIDFVEAFLLLETINVNIITEYPIEEWILVTFHFLKGNTTEQNFNLIIKSLNLNNLLIGNVTASFYMNKKTIKMTEKNMNRILTILSKVVRRRSSRIKTSNQPKLDKKTKEDHQNDALLGSCWQPVEAGTEGK
ncbi:conserved Plasmodium protein, unknown function [Plasmodium knowlesi strain H]|uniref:Uncharacterized protein n=3 Tax=Plasmodium knowlesi TaxID=5850 RepID=A0A5K1UTY8_PLAKH|nr:conserved Plasmodium protein, unknown function [Plasmodium knowlesi strain H]OTN63923.1 Uncharacterized protein PKNOH_S140242000 [Plasmodium knowlesi]CAA9990839.1 conserved Plasmodium protein, unknown function [Plasmodium knowlesi strain H]SBO20964.1 conserved Plasmodium protein, unknown function [Plasmodium knowlesi strain H]VVS80313.1 conserved Plasmodium protein, unknown function [Plasmodium knowlesi strain H]|eukprot:XP_002262127.1 hypothetical protein, conserved in Plasmodium species [Plasmodium knowlesi strain H]